jgi:anti-sigma factor RsiW
MTRTEPQHPPLAPHVALDEYATGVLSAHERGEVEKHLEGCAECRAELAAIEALRSDLRGAYDREPGPGPRVRRAVFEHIDADGRDRVVPIGTKRRVPSLPRWAQLAALVLIVVQGGLLVRPTTEPVVATGPVVARGLEAQPTRLLISFNPNATEAQMRGVLEALGAHIVDGPTRSGEYRIELPAGEDPKRMADRLAAARAQGDLVQSLVIAP